MEYRLQLILVIQLSTVFTLVVSQTSQASCSVWTSLANTNYAGGTANSASDLAGCQAACIADASCVAIDWNPLQASGLRCWILQSLSGTKFAVGNSGITHYDLNRPCLNGGSGTSPTCASWTDFANTNYGSGVPTAETTIESCKASCVANLSCIAIDFNPAAAAGRRCWQFSSLTGLVKFTGTNSGITHSDLSRICIGASASFDRRTLQIDSAPDQDASLAVDGSATTVSCTTSTFTQPWWAVRLDMPSFVLSVKVVGSTQANLLDNFLVGLSNSKPMNGSTLSTSNYTLCAQYNGSVAASATIIVSCSSSSSSRPYQYVIIRSSKPAGTPLCLAEVEVNIKTDTVYKILYTKTAAVVSQGSSFLLSYDITSAALLVEIPCLASNLSGLIRTQNCFTWYTVEVDSPTRYLTGYSLTSIKLLPSSIQGSTERFLEDTSFYVVLNSTSGYSSIQPVVYPDINFYQRTLGTTAIDLGITSDPAMFYFSPVTLPNNPITGSCPNVWTRIPSANSSSSWRVLDRISTSVECRSRCLVYPNCTGATFIPSTWDCFLDNSGSSLVMSTVYSAVYYDLRRTYPDKCTRGCVNVFGSPQSLFTNCGQCSPTQRIYINQTDPNAVLQPGVTGESDCFTACINNRLCTGYELASDGKCSLSLDIFDLSDSNSTTYFGVWPSICGNGCRDKWDFYVDTSMRGASLRSTYKSEYDCRLACQSDQYCTKIDWNKTTGSCYFGNATTTVNIIGTSPGWNHFEFSEQLYCGEQDQYN